MAQAAFIHHINKTLRATNLLDGSIASGLCAGPWSSTPLQHLPSPFLAQSLLCAKELFHWGLPLRDVYSIFKRLAPTSIKLLKKFHILAWLMKLRSCSWPNLGFCCEIAMCNKNHIVPNVHKVGIERVWGVCAASEFVARSIVVIISPRQWLWVQAVARHFYSLNMPVASRFQFRSLFHRDDTLGIPTDDLIFDNVAKDNQSVARIGCRLGGSHDRAQRRENLAVPQLQIQHDIFECKRAI